MQSLLENRRATFVAAALVGALAMAVALSVAAPARALEVKDFAATVSTHQAGAHPDSTVQFRFAVEGVNSGAESAPACNGIGPVVDADYCVVKGGSPRDTVFELPKGLVGSLRGVPTCTFEQLSQPNPLCPVASQVGIIYLPLIVGGILQKAELKSAVYNMQSRPGEAALLGFRTSSVVNSFISLKVRNGGDYGLMARTENIFDGLPIAGATFTAWGQPADPSHDSERYCPLQSSYGCSALDGINPRAFMTNPPECDVPGSVVMDARAWGAPNDWVTATSAPETMEGCDREAFNAGFSAGFDSTNAGAPGGLSVHLSLPDTYGNSSGLATPPLRDATITLPQGMALNPSTASGLGACSTAQMHLDSEQHGECPESSRIGTVKVTTPLLDDTFAGSLYIGSQLSDDPRSGEMFRVMLEIENEERGVDIRLPGRIVVDPGTGQITTSFADNPQLPFSTLDVQLKSGPRAPLTLPKRCGTYDVEAELVGWGVEDRPVKLKSPLQVNANCGPAGFSPGFQAGTSNPIGGSYSPFTLRVTNPEGQQNLSTIQATLPEGLLAKLAGVALCPEAGAATGNCPQASQVGTATVGAGAGPEPIYVPQPGRPPTAVYLAGPYKGAPYSLVAMVPAQAGPFDLGTVTVRNALYVDPNTTQVTAKSDPLPQIVQGVPITYRDVRVSVDRSDFTVNPTSCDPMEVKGSLGSIDGGTANVSDRFQVADCERLAFKPGLKIQLRGATGRLGHPALKAVLTPKPGEANIGRAQVNLPHGEFLDQGNLNKTCTRPVLMAGQCPKSTVYGTARAWTPLLDRPLEGNVYLVGGYGYKLPALVADLDGQIRVLLVGKVDSGQNKGIRNTFEMVPDAPVSRFVLQMKGGRKYGLLENEADLCTTPKGRRRAIVRFTGQNGKVDAYKPVVQAQCGKKHKKQAKKKGGHGR